jgi:hypothetical protein
LGDFLDRYAEAVELSVDSKSALALAKNPAFHERSKNICITYQFIRSCLDEGNIKRSNLMSFVLKLVSIKRSNL